MSSCQSVVLSVCLILSYGQVGAVVPGGFIHSIHHSISVLGSYDSLALLKLDMKNALIIHSFLTVLQRTSLRLPHA